MKNLRRIFTEADGALEMLFKNVYTPNKKLLDIEDAVRLGFFEDIVQKVDSLIALIEIDKVTGLDTITRSIMESHVYLKFLTSNKSQLYGRSYLAAQNVKNLKTYELLTARGQRGSKLRSFLNTSIDNLNKNFKIENTGQSKQERNN